MFLSCATFGKGLKIRHALENAMLGVWGYECENKTFRGENPAWRENPLFRSAQAVFKIFPQILR
jgi:hypothetical protein